MEKKKNGKKKRFIDQFLGADCKRCNAREVVKIFEKYLLKAFRAVYGSGVFMVFKETATGSTPFHIMGSNQTYYTADASVTATLYDANRGKLIESISWKSSKDWWDQPVGRLVALYYMAKQVSKAQATHSSFPLLREGEGLPEVTVMEAVVREVNKRDQPVRLAPKISKEQGDGTAKLHRNQKRILKKLHAGEFVDEIKVAPILPSPPQPLPPVKSLIPEE